MINIPSPVILLPSYFWSHSLSCTVTASNKCAGSLESQNGSELNNSLKSSSMDLPILIPFNDSHAYQVSFLKTHRLHKPLSLTAFTYDIPFLELPSTQNFWMWLHVYSSLKTQPMRHLGTFRTLWARDTPLPP